ncbi:HEAT repeat domain-containing protein [Actinomadura algeriensis]|uniref:HEAT repeat protein n=1 Tax=Actinomadura algeriensis TaxID=1679523 RepID=A0ABR9JQZ6_9ACTN|nr:HEAT repeat domain-containing protein [Actinomadura algeriensis]MBE1532985.1 HEAT repeat protein [Actinomadura algeriensis]
MTDLPRILELLSDIARALFDIEEHDEDEYPAGVHADLVRWARDARPAVETGLPTLARLLDDEDPAVRAAAATALLWCGADDLDDTLLQALADEIQAPDSALDGRLWTLDGGRPAFLTAALDDRPAPQIQSARAALAIPTPATVARAGHIMRTWRTAPAALLPSLAALLTTEAAADAAWQIKQGGPDIALITDPLSPFLGHPDDTVAGSALEALARIGDARAVPVLAAEDVREFLNNPKKGTALNRSAS